MTHLPRPLLVAASGSTYRLALDARRPVATQRRLTGLAARMTPVPAGTRVEHVVLGGRPTERVALGRVDDSRAVLYLHGGGYVVGSARMYRPLAAHLSRATRAAVYCVDYRLAPEHPFPAAFDDAVAAARELAASAGRLALAGDSAGGGLAVATARVLTDEGSRPAALGLLSPWTDPGDRTVDGRDFVVNRAWGEMCSQAYLGDGDPLDPGFAPLQGRLDGLPPMLVHTSTDEILNPQIHRFAELARAAGSEVELVEHADLWHSGHMLAGLLRPATVAVRDVGLFLRGHLSVTPAAERGAELRELSA